MRLLCEHQSGELKNMLREMESVTRSAFSHNLFSAVAKSAALVDRAKKDALALARVTDSHTLATLSGMRRRGYRPQLCRATIF